MFIMITMAYLWLSIHTRDKQRLLPNTAEKRSFYSSNTCLDSWWWCCYIENIRPLPYWSRAITRVRKENNKYNSIRIMRLINNYPILRFNYTSYFIHYTLVFTYFQEQGEGKTVLNYKCKYILYYICIVRLCVKYHRLHRKHI